MSLSEFKPLFGSLDAPRVRHVAGTYESELVGPNWLRTIAPPVLALGGLGGWCGKWFDGAGNAHNLVRRKGNVEPVLRMVVRQQPSHIDGETVLAVIYPQGLRAPWPWIVDEFRILDRYTLLGMMVVKPLGLKRLPAPFLLHVGNQAQDFASDTH